MDGWKLSECYREDKQMYSRGALLDALYHFYFSCNAERTPSCVVCVCIKWNRHSDNAPSQCLADYKNCFPSSRALAFKGPSDRRLIPEMYEKQN